MVRIRPTLLLDSKILCRKDATDRCGFVDERDRSLSRSFARLALFTDGIIEAENATGEMFGDQLFDNIPEGLETVVRKLELFVSGTPIVDDYTMAVLKYRSPAEA
jgi:serine phosphatase RsbU (regulator of sigma subunit)